MYFNKDSHWSKKSLKFWLLILWTYQFWYRLWRKLETRRALDLFCSLKNKHFGLVWINKRYRHNVYDRDERTSFHRNSHKGSFPKSLIPALFTQSILNGLFLSLARCSFHWPDLFFWGKYFKEKSPLKDVLTPLPEFHIRGRERIWGEQEERAYFDK